MKSVAASIRNDLIQMLHSLLLLCWHLYYPTLLARSTLVLARPSTSKTSLNCDRYRRAHTRLSTGQRLFRICESIGPAPWAGNRSSASDQYIVSTDLIPNNVRRARSSTSTDQNLRSLESGSSPLKTNSPRLLVEWTKPPFKWSLWNSKQRSHLVSRVPHSPSDSARHRKMSHLVSLYGIYSTC